MLVFVDESGDAGFKFDQNSSQFFIVAMVVFDDDAQATATANQIARFRQSLKQKDEFKFSKMSRQRRQDFAELIKTLDFVARVFVIDKLLVDPKQFSQYGTDTYQWMLAEALIAFQDEFSQARLKLDGTQNRHFKRTFKSYIRQRLEIKINDLVFVDSESTELLQLADFVAGAVHRQQRGEDVEKIVDSIQEKFIIKKLKKNP